MRIMMVLLTVSAAFTTLATQAIKTMMGDKKFSPNILAAIVSVIVAGLVAAGWVVIYEVVLTPQIWVQIIALIILSWLTAMVGYDKVKQTILQLQSNDE